jgi:hypothetical protein
MIWTKKRDKERFGDAVMYRKGGADKRWCAVYGNHATFHATKREARDWCEAAVKQGNAVAGRVEV